MSKVNYSVIAEAINDPNFSFISSFADAGESAKVTKEMTRLLFINKKLREELKTRERERVVLAAQHDKAKRISYQKHSQSSANEKTKTVLVEIDTEQTKYSIDILDQTIKELNREMAAIKLEIDTFKSIVYNLRTEMGSF